MSVTLHKTPALEVDRSMVVGSAFPYIHNPLIHRYVNVGTDRNDMVAMHTGMKILAFNKVQGLFN